MLEKLDRISESLNALVKELNALRNEVLAAANAGQPGESSAAAGSSASLAAIGSFFALSPQMDEDLLLKTILQCAMYVTGAAGAALCLYDREKGKLIFRTAVGPGAEKLIGLEVPLQGSANGLAFATGEVISMTPVHREADLVTGIVYRNVLVAPLIVGEEGVGTINAVNKQNGDNFTVEDMEAYKLFADLAAQVVQQRLQSETLKRMLKGERVSAAKGLEAIARSQSDLTLLKIAEDIGILSAGRDDLLSLFQQLTGLMVEISSRLRW